MQNFACGTLLGNALSNFSHVVDLFLLYSLAPVIPKIVYKKIIICLADLINALLSEFSKRKKIHPSFRLLLKKYRSAIGNIFCNINNTKTE